MENLEHGWIVEKREEEDVEFCDCEWCGRTIWYGEDYYKIADDNVCEDCIRDCKEIAED